ncbi:MAG: hypothetical protein IH609_18445, partial [Dehalococcoidia bacterium]|nr:hypothetical protein [Dehalococcoidia bacterium]
HVAPPAWDAAGAEVRLSGNCFTPTVLRVEPGTSVTFRNIDPVVHHIAGVAYAWGTPWERQFGEGDTAEFTFSEQGIYPYSCYLHLGMTGAIVVGDGRAASSGGTGASQPVVARANDVLAEAPATEAAVAGLTEGGTGRWVFALLGVLGGLAAGGFVTGMWARRR